MARDVEKVVGVIHSITGGTFVNLPTEWCFKVRYLVFDGTFLQRTEEKTIHH
jgi:hypothetical protein